MSQETIGLIAGKSQFPILFARAARARGLRVAAVAFAGDALAELAAEVDSLAWVRLGELGKIIKAFKAEGVSRAAMCGGVTKPRMFTDAHPDWRTLTLLPRLRHLADDGVLRLFADYLAEKGVAIMPSHELLPELLAPAGNYTRRPPTAEEKSDAELGWRLAHELGKLDIGQAVVVKGKAVVAVEAMEGTDACIRRGGELAGPGAVVIKRCKPGQDRRFDLPAVGADTVAVMAEAGATCLVIEAGRTLAFDRAEMTRRAEVAGICLLAWAGAEDK